MRFVLVAASSLLIGTTAFAQEVSVPGVTVANPGGYANPLKLDTERYMRNNANSSDSEPAPHGWCNQRRLTEAERSQLEDGYLSRAQRRSHHGWVWVEQQCGATAAFSIERSAKRRAAGR